MFSVALFDIFEVMESWISPPPKWWEYAPIVVPPQPGARGINPGLTCTSADGFLLSGPVITINSKLNGAIGSCGSSKLVVNPLLVVVVVLGVLSPFLYGNHRPIAFVSCKFLEGLSVSDPWCVHSDINCVLLLQPRDRAIFVTLCLVIVIAVFIWCSYDVHMMFIWCSYDVPMMFVHLMFIWCSYE